MLLRRGPAQLFWRLVVSAEHQHPHPLPTRALSSTSAPTAATTTTTASEPPPPSPPHPPAPAHAIVRAVSRGFADAIVSAPPPPSSSASSSSPSAAAEAWRIDPALATQQHARYVALLSKACPSPLNIVELDAPDDLPDACFVEDTAVIVPGAWLSSGGAKSGAVAVVARPPAPSRSREPEAVARALREHPALKDAVEVVGEITFPGALDGGDVLILPPAAAAASASADDQHSNPPPSPPPTVLVGLSGRTNAEGAAQLRDLLAPRGVRVVPVPMAAALARVPGFSTHGSTSGSFHPLHLKSAVTALSADSLLCADGPAGRAIAAALHGALLRASPPTPPAASAASAAASAAEIPRLPTFAFLPEEDACAANVLLLGDAVVAQPALEASRRVLEFLCERLGRRLVLLDPPLTEMKKADGALTCCSILF